MVEEVVVTGSQIRGAADGSSPLVTLTREGLDRSGRGTVADALALLPQTFNGSSNPQTLLTGADGLGTNLTASSGVNLRGLGANSTLVLVNGRRLAGSGIRGDFADISAIPTAAVDRVEVLLDGASALYGSDAVGGVVNVILRRDFSGAETRIRVGGATQGGDASVQAGQTFGRTWTGGRMVLSYEYERRDHLAGADRTQTADADLRRLGGSDQRGYYSLPGNILGPDASGAYVPTYAIPPGQDGRGLRPQDFLQGGINLENTRTQGDILPNQTRNSGYLSLAQDLGARVHLGLEARYTRRDLDFRQPGALGIFLVTPANPFYVAPDSAPVEVLGYAFGDEIGPIRVSGDADNAGISAGATFDLGQTWKLDVYADYAQERGHLETRGLINSGNLEEALGNSPDDPTTPYVAARDGFFNPFGSGTSNSAAVLAFVGSGSSTTDTLSRDESINIKADGALFHLPAGDVKVAFGAQVRRDLFKTSTSALQVGVVPTTSGGSTFGRTISAGFAELRIPLFGPDNAQPGLQRLELSLAGRVEGYDDVGLSGNPKLGLLWSPADGLRLRGSYGTSFRAPGLPEEFAPQVIAPAILTRGASRVLTLVRYGGNGDLTPETATTWTVGGEWRPRLLKGLALSATYFDIDYADRIGQPVLEDVVNALSDPSYAPFVQNVDPTRSAADLAAVSALLAQSTSPSAKLFPANSYGALLDARFVNTARLHLRGLDASASYSLKWGQDAFDVGFSSTLFFDYTRRLTPASGEIDLSGETGQPASLRTRTTAGWARGPFGATLGVSYVSGSAAITGAKVDSWTTLDGQLSWRAPQAQGPFNGLQLTLSVINLLDAGPPFYDASNGLAYDPANSDPVGRTVSLQLVKRW